jgi:uncharacterized membrane protein
MGRVSHSVEIDVMASTAEALWYDLNRWPSFVDGFGHVEKQGGEWPQAGASLQWTSAPGGRGHVLERVVSYEPRVGQESQIADEKMTGRQRVTFKPGPSSVVVTLELEYEITADWPLKGLMDALFVRRPMRDSITRTLVRFRREAVTDRELGADG